MLVYIKRITVPYIQSIGPGYQDLISTNSHNLRFVYCAQTPGIQILVTNQKNCKRTKVMEETDQTPLDTAVLPPKLYIAGHFSSSEA